MGESIKNYLKLILAKYGAALAILLVLYFGISIFAIGFADDDLKMQAVFTVVIITVVVAIPPVYILYDSFEKNKDASQLCFLSIFLSYYAIIWYLMCQKKLKNITFESKK